MNPCWFAQRVPPLGAITSEGIKNPLGRPSLDRLTVLVREAAQNSWDARPDGQEGGVSFSLDLRRVATSGPWREHLLSSVPQPEHLPLRPVIDNDDMTVLFVSDRGTKGLGGPTRGGGDPGSRKDYLSFVLNVGVPRDREFGGGTFGFGKASFYNCATAQSILVYTRTLATDGWPAESRLIGIGLGSSHVKDGHEYTGRYWWGVPEADIHVEPVRGATADELAARLGFPPFEGGETGTTIAIIGCELEDYSPDEAARHLAAAITWHLWPKLATGEMAFSVTCDGRDVPIAGPDDHPVIAHFASVLRGLSLDNAVRRSGTEIGRLRIETSFAPRPVIDAVGKAAGFDDGVHHVCLMRHANLVVEYVPGEALPDEHLWYAGVFRSADTFDAAFAAAEPPTHDTWEPAQLEPEQRRVVKHALRKIKDGLRDHVRPAHSGGGEEASPASLGALSAELGGLIAPTIGGGASTSSQSASSSGSRSAVKMVGGPRWEELDGDDVLVQDFEFTGTRTTTVEARLGVVLWGGSGESEAPAGGDAPRLRQWRHPNGNTTEDLRLALGKDDSGKWSVVISPAGETATSIVVREARRDLS